MDDVDNPDGVTIVNLEHDLPYPLIGDIVQTLKEQEQSSVQMSRALAVSVYKDNVLINPRLLSLDNDLNLTITNRDINAVYRLLISEYIGEPNGTIHAFWVGKYDIITNQR